jgi:uncharacterized repeat protein (TIGR02543 family)
MMNSSKPFQTALSVICLSSALAACGGATLPEDGTIEVKLMVDATSISSNDDTLVSAGSLPSDTEQTTIDTVVEVTEEAVVVEVVEVVQEVYVAEDVITVEGAEVVEVIEVVEVVETVEVVEVVETTAESFEVTVSAFNGGSVSGSGYDCEGLCISDFDDGNEVSLTAAAKDGFTFSGWSGACDGTDLSCSFTVSSNTDVSANFTSNQTQNLCEGLVADKTPREKTAFDKPGLLESYIDPAFGTKVRRITDVNVAGGVIKPVYNNIQAWNADESRMVLYQSRASTASGHYLYDGKTYSKIKRLNISATDMEDVFWDFEDPRYLYYAQSRQLRRINVETDEIIAIHDFSDICSGHLWFGGDVQTPSWDNNVWGLRCDRESIFTYNATTDQVSGYLEAADTTLSMALAPNVSPSGQFFYQNGSVFDAGLNLLHSFDLRQGAEHSTLGVTHDAQDAYIQVAFGPSPNGCNGDSRNGVGAAVLHNFSDGSCRVLMGESNGWGYPPSATHLSAVSHKNPGWVALSSVGARFNSPDSGLPTLWQEIYLTNTDPDNQQTCRIAHHRSWGKSGSVGYMAEPHVTLSPSGTRLLFGSDWDNSGSVDTYIIELPSYQAL